MNRSSFGVRVPCRPARGLTLIELLVGISITAILLMIAVPSFNATIASARASDAANSIQAALDVARSEAIRRNANVTVCRVPNPAAPACDMAAAGGFAANDWASGWVVFVDDGANPGVIDAGEIIITRQNPFGAGGGMRAVILGGAVGTITYGANGLRIAAGAPLNLNIAYRLPTAVAGGDACRLVSIGVTGQTNITRVNPPCP